MTRNAMIHRCTIQRDPSLQQEDAWGNPTDPAWVDHATTACYYYLGKTTSVVDGERQFLLSQPMLMLPLESDVTGDDRISPITDRRGRLIKTGPLRIVQIGPRADHLALVLAGVE